MPAGRPSKYTQDLADRLCEQLAEGNSMHRVCEADGMPDKRTVFRWLRTNKEFRHQYEEAKSVAADKLAEEIIEIADDGRNDYMETIITEASEGCPEIIGRKLHPENIQRSRLRVDARKWIASKLKPKKYGDKTVLGSDEDNPLFPTAVNVNVVRPEKRSDPTDD